MEWFYRGLAGIDQSANSIAYKEIVIDPQTVGDLTSANATFECMYGAISTEWKKKNNSFEIKVEIPANATAVIFLPSATASKILEGNTPVEQNTDIELIGVENGKTKLKIGSGSYFFVVNNE